MKLIKIILEEIFNCIYPVLKPQPVQLFLRRLGFRFPYYRFAEKLQYKGSVDFKVNGKTLYMKSYNYPFEIFIFWYGIYGYWEPTQLRIWSQLVKDADIILDIGANNGIYSLIASTNSKAKIFAFEPVPDVIEMLQTNVRLNQPNKITVEPLVVGNKVGEQVLYIPRSGWTDVASLDKKFASTVYGEGTNLQELVCKMTTVDTVIFECDRKSEQVLLCKIDVEQAEVLVLQGMKNVLATQNVEFIIELLTEENFNLALDLIPNNYYIFAVNEESKIVTLVTRFTSKSTNYLFTQDSQKTFAL